MSDFEGPASWDMDAAEGPAQDVPPTRFAAAYAELQAIAGKLKPVPGQVPDVDQIEPLVRRANVLARFCQERIDAVRSLVDEQQPS